MAVYIRKDVDLREIPANVRNLEAVVMQSREVQLFAVYNRPQTFLIDEDLQILTGHNDIVQRGIKVIIIDLFFINNKPKLSKVLIKRNL